MTLLKDLFSKPNYGIHSYSDFWTWFRTNEKRFFKVVNGGDVEKDFFKKLSPKLAELREGYYYLTGMPDDNTVELIFTADGIVKNFVFVEELVASAPDIGGWKFTAHKQSLDIEDVNIEMAGYKFNKSNLWFYPVNADRYSDAINITIVHSDLNDENRGEITNGVYIFLDNYLGELNFAMTIDDLSVEKPTDKHELIPITKLMGYLNWRQKEFIEKYDGVRYNTENDNHSVLEATLEDDKPLIAVVNGDLLRWERRASHPWMLVVEIKYDGSSDNGMPDHATRSLMDALASEMNAQLKDADGYLNVARQTANGTRQIYFACKEFMKASKVMDSICKEYGNTLELQYDIYKDKYWRTLDRFGVD